MAYLTCSKYSWGALNYVQINTICIPGILRMCLKKMAHRHISRFCIGTLDLFRSSRGRKKYHERVV